MVGLNFNRKRRRGGFTLVELMVVAAIMLALGALAMLSLRSVSASAALTRGAQVLADEMTLARQEAIGKNRDIQVRLIRLDGEPAGYRAVQLWAPSRADITKFEPAARPKTLPAGVIIADHENLSPLLAGAPLSVSGTQHDRFPSLGTGELSYVAFRFRPGGGTDLPAGNNTPPFNNNNYFTVVAARNAAAETLPADHAIVQIDPQNGNISIYRP